ncbi:MAG: asparagine synthase (glutamine-hydrolyzing) [Bacteroidota bacterium]|nr:asparagine synthase (glutamine-hydrolyzing) [Bacteroidota bacterium]
MCGITGFIDFSKRSDEIVLSGMINTMLHRGPDGCGIQIFKTNSEHIGLAHRRLAVIDLTDTGKQPMHFSGLWVTFNGEIYNYKEIKNELIASNHQFIGNSDTEVVLHAFKEWGMECIKRFIGMFAFVLYDSNQSKVFCVRDRAGVKPFYYYWKDNLFLFASELKAFHKHPDFKKELNVDAVAAFIQYGNVPSPYCIYKHCNKLEPGHYMEFDSSNIQLNIHKYWDVYDSYNKPKLDISFDEAKTETEKKLVSAANYRMVSDVPVGIFLSGGYDSVCLASVLQKSRTEKIKTYTIGVSDSSINEAPFAKKIAEFLGTEHHEYYCVSKDAIELIDQLPYFYDEPFADSSAIPTMLVCKIARKEVTVALSADGGDELFAGYNRYDYLMKNLQRVKNTPLFLRKSMAFMMSAAPISSLPGLRSNYAFKNKYRKVKDLLYNPTDKNLMLNLSTLFNSREVDNLFLQPVNELKTAYLKNELKEEFYTSLSYMMAIDYQTYLTDDIMQKVDRASMSVSLEAREPYLDHRLIEWSARLPDQYKYNRGVKKFILKEIVHSHIPKDLMERPKMGFAIPINDWLKNELKEKIRYYLSENNIKKQGIFNWKTINEYVTHFMNGKNEFGTRVWYLLMFQMWYEKWMRN